MSTDTSVSRSVHVTSLPRTPCSCSLRCEARKEEVGKRSQAVGSESFFQVLLYILSSSLSLAKREREREHEERGCKQEERDAALMHLAYSLEETDTTCRPSRSAYREASVCVCFVAPFLALTAPRDSRVALRSSNHFFLLFSLFLAQLLSLSCALLLRISGARGRERERDFGADPGVCACITCIMHRFISRLSLCFDSFARFLLPFPFFSALLLLCSNLIGRREYVSTQSAAFSSPNS